MAFSLKVPCFAKPRSSLEVPKELLIDSVPPSEIVIGGGRACEVSVGHFGGQKVALKKYIGIRGNAEYESVILKEAAAIYKTRHENVVGIRFVCLKEMTLGLEYCEKVLTDEDGNPHSFNNARQILGFLSVLSSEVSREIAPVLFSSMACQVSEGLRYLHSIKIIHADLKSANVLVTEKRGRDDSWLFKLADFGESRLSLVTSVVTSTTQDQSQQNRGGTICFMSPERCDNKRPTFACDLFSFGMFLYELHDFTIKFPFEKDGFPVDVIVNKIRSGVLPCHEDMSSPLKEVFLKCCAFEPKARPTVFELCKMLTELAPEAFMQPDRALNSTIQFPILNSNNDSYQENFSVSDLPLTDLSQPVSHSEFSSSGLPDSHLLVSEVMVPATEPSQMILDAVAGCALRNFGITQLKDFQIRSITNILKKEDALVVSGTGSGKSICYQIPSVMESGITLLVVPTIALRKDQSDFLLSRGIDSFVVGEKIAPVEYDQQVTAISDLSENKPVILVGTPESFMGREGSLGIVRRQRSLLDRRLKFVVFDECHLLYEWCGFRSSFLELKSLRSFFPRATFLALTATLLPKDEKLIIEEFLHNPCVVRMSVDRPNVRLEISHYSPPSGLEGSLDWVESWSEAAKRIIGTVNGQLAIVYFSYAREANAACSAISSLGVKAAAFTGECSSLDKNHIHAAMRNGEIEILCATTAYGCGLNLPDVRCVVRFGLPKNMSSWMQEQGRAGRDGKPARAVILLNEKYDINRCVFWLDGSSDGDKKSMLTNFVDVLNYAYSGFSGLCLRKFQVKYFGESLPQGDAQNCCQSCDDQSFQDASGEIRKVVDCLKLFYDRGISSVSETHITSFLMGRSDKWLREHLVDADYTAYPFHSFVGVKGQHVLSGLIRQASSLGIVTIHLREMFFGGRREVRKFFSLGMSLPEVVKLPPVLYSKSAFSVCTSLTPSIKPRPGVVDKVLAALLSGSWKNATLGMLKYPGYTENSGVSEVLFIDDVKTIYDGDDDYVFLMGNMQLTRKGGMPKFEKVVMLPNDESQISVLVRVNECAGVKQCTAAGCEFSLQNCFSRNTCLEHPDEPLKNKCCGCRIAFVCPVKKKDHRRWVISFSNDDGRLHSHARPPENRLVSRVRSDIVGAVARDPTLTVSEIHKGVGVGYILGERNLAAVNLDRVRKFVDAVRKGPDSLPRFLETFNEAMLKEIPLFQNDDKQINLEMQQATLKYLRFFSLDQGNSLCLLMFDIHIDVLAKADFLIPDVTYPGTFHPFKYLLNVVVYDSEILQYVTVARVLMSNLHRGAYKSAFGVLFDEVKKKHPDYCPVNLIVIADFSEAQKQGLKSAVESQSTFNESDDIQQSLIRIRGCRVHFWRSVNKISQKICSTKDEVCEFKSVARLLESAPNKQQADLCFSVLSGKPDQKLLKAFPCLISAAALRYCDGWSQAASWVSFWSRANNLKMICKALSEFTDREWDVLPATTNAVESHNRISKPSCKTIAAALKWYYRIDRTCAVKYVAARHGVGIKYPSKRCKKPGKLSTPSDWSEEVSSQDVSFAASVDGDEEFVGRFIMVNTVGVKGKHYGKLLAKVVERTEDGYRAMYHDTPSYETYVGGPDDPDVDLLPLSFEPPPPPKQKR